MIRLAQNDALGQGRGETLEEMGWAGVSVYGSCLQASASLWTHGAGVRMSMQCSGSYSIKAE